MFKYFNKLITANSGTSSKRFISLYALLLLTACIVVSFFGIEVNVNIYCVLSGLILSSSALTLGQKSKPQNNLNL